MNLKISIFFLSIAAAIASVTIAFWGMPQSKHLPSTDRLNEQTNSVTAKNKPVQQLLCEISVGKDGRPLFLAGKLGGQKVQFLFDTGTSRTGIDKRFLTLLGRVTGTCVLETPAGKIERDVYSCPPIELGNLPVSPRQEVFCQDFREISEGSGVEIAGVIGMDVISQYVVQIDFDGGILRLYSTLPDRNEGLGVPFPVTYVSGVPQVTGFAANVQRDFLIDTGSTNTCVDVETFKSLAVKGDLNIGSLPITVVTGGGNLRVKRGLLRSLTLGKNVHHEIICDNDTRNMLGLRYLSRYMMTMDFPNNTMYFKSGGRYDLPDCRGLSGIRPRPTENGFQVVAVAPGGPAELAGVQMGDEIIEIDGKTTAGMDMFSVGQILTRTPGREVTLKLRRGFEDVCTSLVIGDMFR